MLHPSTGAIENRMPCKICQSMESNLYSDETLVINCMRHLKKLFDWLLILKKGYHQDAPTVPKKTIYRLAAARSLTYLVTFRMIFCLSIDDVHLKYLLGYPYKENAEGVLLSILMSLTYILFSLLRELVYYFESNGKMAVTVELNYLLALTPGQLHSLSRLKVFIRYMKYFLPNWIALFYFFLCMTPIFSIQIRLINPDIWTNHVYIISSIIWMIPEALTIVYVVGGLIIFFGHALMFLMIYYSRLCYLLHQFGRLVEMECSTTQANELLIKLNYSFIKFLNDITKQAYDVRYVWLYMLLLACGLNNTCLYCGTIKQIKPIILAFSLTIYGVCEFVISAIAIHKAGEIIEKIYAIHNHYIKLSLKLKTRLDTRLKVLEILQRIMSPRTCPTIGDFFEIKKSVVMTFIMENICLILLITVNANR
ncbi:uncharacterized protein LOC112539753 [Tetranychus urticae]|uniref:Gustatory receptor n=1 Tax=Tetranychus urticae TaxID=32264 RepID=T1L5C2_TETUR|nr:uncharacterized protein LOC112539753 [Tetranychus urticae]